MKNSIKNCPDFHLAVISTRRPARVPKMAEVLSGMTATWYVSEGEGEEYRKAGAARVVECAPNISVARNAAIRDARKEGLASIQASDDLRGVNVVSMQSGIVKSRKSNAEEAIGILLHTQKKTKKVYGGVAVTNNRLNYNGKDLSFGKFVACDLILVSPECPFFDEEMALKEDYDMTLTVGLKHGGTFRCDNVLCDFPHRGNAGGANTYRTTEVEDAVTQRMFKKWGSLIMPHATRPGQISLRKTAFEQEMRMRGVEV